MALRPISRMDDFAFPPDGWDVRGWKVRTAQDEKKVGKVDDMLIDGSGQLRYLDVDLGFMKKHVLVPLDRSHADREHEIVWVEGLTKERLEEGPEYALEPESLDESYERRLDAYFDAHSVHTGAVGAPHRDRPERTYETPLEAAGDPSEPLELRRMSDMEDEYEIGGGDPRGWKVVTGEGVKVGKVSELLVDPADMKARFLDVVVDEKELDLERVDRHVLLPSDQVQLNRSSKKVVVAGLLAPDLARYPQYGGLPLLHGQVRDIHDYLGRAGRLEEPRTREPSATRQDAGTDHAARHFYGHRQARQDPGEREE